jgi:hypothetical protein
LDLDPPGFCPDGGLKDPAQQIPDRGFATSGMTIL